MTDRLTLQSLSHAMDGGLTAISEIAAILTDTNMLERSRLIGGVTVMIHQQRLGVQLPLRTTGDADFGVPPYALREPQLVTSIEAQGYTKVAGNRWERPIDTTRTATVDLLIPTYRSRARNNVRIGNVTTTEVPGLAESLRRPGIDVAVDIVLTDRTSLTANVVIPDAPSTLALKAWARTVRREDRDAEDLWRCLEIALAEGVTRETLISDPTLVEIVPILQRELTPGGDALNVITRGVNSDEATRRATRLRALLAEVAGIT